MAEHWGGGEEGNGQNTWWTPSYASCTFPLASLAGPTSLCLVDKVSTHLDYISQRSTEYHSAVVYRVP